VGTFESLFRVGGESNLKNRMFSREPKSIREGASLLTLAN